MYNRRSDQRSWSYGGFRLGVSGCELNFVLVLSIFLLLVCASDYPFRIQSETIAENGSIRINSARIADEYRRVLWPSWTEQSLSWLAQANYIFDNLGITSNLESYALVEHIEYRLRFSGPQKNLPAGYLFVCNAQNECPERFQMSDCPAYWSFDPSGRERLSLEEARHHGFPDIQLDTEVLARSWNRRVYDGIREFHAGKGFDPHSQEAAMELGGPLFQVSCERDALVAHMQDNESDWVLVV
ncbi:hypothetical protein B0H19DRAFT_647047 [Mycena capillaripes]|nr:hypothetical protein B0H19DRAFT_647047 [Mycena capillaripes]